MWSALLVGCAVGFGPQHEGSTDPWNYTVTCPAGEGLTELQSCVYGCAENTVLPSATNCIHTYCLEKGSPVTVSVILDDSGYNGDSESINNVHPELCGCWLGTTLDGSSVESMIVRDVNDQECSAYDPQQPWNHTLFSEAYPSHQMADNVTKYCTACAPAPTPEPTASPTDSPTASPTNEPTSTTTTTSTTTATATTVTVTTTTVPLPLSCADLTGGYRWPRPLVASQTGCLLTIARDGVGISPWPGPFASWIVGSSQSGQVTEVAILSSGSQFRVGDDGTVTGGSGVGVQYAVTAVTIQSQIATIQLTDAGTGYAVGDTLTLAPTSGVGTNAQLTVTTVNTDPVVRLTGRYGSDHTATLAQNTLTFAPAKVGPIQLGSGDTASPTTAPTPPTNHVCGSTEVGLHFVGDQTFKAACNEWKPVYCRDRPDNSQCQCFCGVPESPSVKDEAEKALLWAVLGANSIVFGFLLILLFYHLTR